MNLNNIKAQCRDGTALSRFCSDCPDFKKIFLGYDYAYAAGDNYSAVYNEIPFVFTQFQLNQYGLFQTREEIEEYIVAREKFKLTHPPLMLEILLSLDSTKYFFD